MSRQWIKTEGGHTSGHSNMQHWTLTEEIKKATKKERRRQDKEAVRPEPEPPQDKEAVRPEPEPPQDKEAVRPEPEPPPCHD